VSVIFVTAEHTITGRSAGSAEPDARKRACDRMLRQRAAVATDVPPNFNTTVRGPSPRTFVVAVVVVVVAFVVVVVMELVVAKVAAAVNAARRAGGHGAGLR
jgi:hypothetical protein